ncbi:hypothetical protein M2651_03620 [Clostridium sp. SYSU_GA19001]|uniref:hypothetical protein n=1 Tax=Clostridium caldaquaticum TaxID=2940653 RepID=UPI002077901B|nr:hypothetical protein [Clostridium caldaquaticum]MCM8710117.1 hypothetical protein [Clostridium caldaquaticum]
METTIMALTLDPRTAQAPKVQSVLTNHGCAIRARIGLHEQSSDFCSEKGLILLQLNSDLNEVEKLEKELLNLEGVKVKHMTL